MCYGRDPLHEQAHKNDHFHHFSSNSRKSPVSGRFHAKVSPERKQTGVFYVSNAFVCGLRSILRLKIGIFYHFFQELVKWLWRMGFEFHAAIVKFRSRWTQIIKNNHFKIYSDSFYVISGLYFASRRLEMHFLRHFRLKIAKWQLRRKFELNIRAHNNLGLWNDHRPPRKAFVDIFWRVFFYFWALFCPKPIRNALFMLFTVNLV